MSINFSIFNLHFLTDIMPEMLKLCIFTKVKVFFTVLVYIFNFDLFEFSAAILKKGLLISWRDLDFATSWEVGLVKIWAWDAGFFSPVCRESEK